MDITVYFDYGSPYAYLGWQRITNVHAKKYRGHNVHWKPVSAGHIFAADGTAPNVTMPNQKRYLLRDVQRWADRYQVPFAPPADGSPGQMPVRSIEAGRLHFAAAEAGPATQEAWMAAVFNAYFRDGRDISNIGVLADLAAQVGLVIKVEEAVQDPAYKQALVQNTQEAYQVGAPGVPFTIVGSEGYWGNDRLDWVEDALGR